VILEHLTGVRMGASEDSYVGSVASDYVVEGVSWCRLHLCENEPVNEMHWDLDRTGVVAATQSQMLDELVDERCRWTRYLPLGSVWVIECYNR
jgi:hypothetical protein